MKLPIPPFAWPIFGAIVIWLILYFCHADSHAVDGGLFVLTLVAVILIGVLGAAREGRNESK